MLEFAWGVGQPWKGNAIETHSAAFSSVGAVTINHKAKTMNADDEIEDRPRAAVDADKFLALVQEKLDKNTLYIFNGYCDQISYNTNEIVHVFADATKN